MQAQAQNARATQWYMPPQSVANSISRFGDAFGAIIIDEAHEITPTIKEIIAHIQSKKRSCPRYWYDRYTLSHE